MRTAPARMLLLLLARISRGDCGGGRYSGWMVGAPVVVACDLTRRGPTSGRTDGRREAVRRRESSPECNNLSTSCNTSQVERVEAV